MKFVNDYGAGFLQLDTEIYNTLLDAKKGNHELLKFFKIQYPEQFAQTHVNCIYVGRTLAQKELNDTTFDVESWNVQIELIITTKEYEHLKRRQLLKSTVYAIRTILKKSSIADCIMFNNVEFEYDNTNVLNLASVTLTGRESYLLEPYPEYKRICKVLNEIETIKLKE